MKLMILILDRTELPTKITVVKSFSFLFKKKDLKQANYSCELNELFILSDNQNKLL